MPGISLRKWGGQSPVVVRKPIGLSQEVRNGDILVLSDHTNETAASTEAALRLLHPTDISNSYAEGGVTLGVYGVALESAIANAAGYVTDSPAGATLAAGVRPSFSMPSMANAVPPSGGTGGHSRVLVAPFLDEHVFGGELLETTTVNEDLIGTLVGIAITPASGTAVRPLRYRWSTAASIKVGVIVGVNPTDPKYNVSGGGAEVFVRVQRLDPQNAAVVGYQQYHNSDDYYNQSVSFAS